jgi:excisionase family DNA binding protein
MEMMMETKPKLTGTVREAAELLGVGLNEAYKGVRRGDIPSMPFGKRKLVLWQPLLRRLNGES